MTIYKTLITTLLITTSLSAQSALVFTEDFDRPNSNTLGNGWLEINKNRNDVAIKNNQLLLRDNKKGQIDAGAAYQIESAGSGLTLSFDWKPLLPSDKKDLLKVSWSTTYSKTASDWQPLFSQSLGANDRQSNTALISSDLMSALNDLDSFYLLFWVDSGPKSSDEYKEGVRLDNIRLSNTETTAPVPLPSTILFFATGLAGLLVPRKSKPQI